MTVTSREAMVSPSFPFRAERPFRAFSALKAEAKVDRRLHMASLEKITGQLPVGATPAPSLAAALAAVLAAMAFRSISAGSPALMS